MNSKGEMCIPHVRICLRNLLLNDFDRRKKDKFPTLVHARFYDEVFVPIFSKNDESNFTKEKL